MGFFHFVLFCFIFKNCLLAIPMNTLLTWFRAFHTKKTKTYHRKFLPKSLKFLSKKRQRIEVMAFFMLNYFYSKQICGICREILNKMGYAEKNKTWNYLHVCAVCVHNVVPEYLPEFFEICFMYQRICQKHTPFVSSGPDMFSCWSLDSNVQTCIRARFQEHVHILSINTSILLSKPQENKVQ